MDTESAMQQLVENHHVSNMRAFTNGADAVRRLVHIETSQRRDLEHAAKALAAGTSTPAQQETRGFYPTLAIPISKAIIADHEEAYGWARAGRGRGLFHRTISRSDFHSDYLTRQIDLMVKRYSSEAIVGLSNVPMPLLYATDEQFPESVSSAFSQVYTDDVATCDSFYKDEHPLALYTALEVDYAWSRFQHYTGTGMEHLQRFVLLTNYQMYMDEFEQEANKALRRRSGPKYQELVMPEAVLASRNGNGKSTRTPQMPAYHLKREDGNGISIINIGVGPSNALNMVRKICTRRPHAVIMVGHCAGLQATQRSGNFVIASSYARFDRILDAELSLRVPLAPIGEIQLALKDALQAELRLKDRQALYKFMQSGVVATVDDRDWECNPELIEEIDETNACALDMESATVAGGCLINATPHASLLCISDNPLDGRPKLAGAAQKFYERSKRAHLRACIRACESLAEDPWKLHSRKLRRPRTQVPFR